nr:hypothetical protein Iba_chr14cCG0060 [Ipomoea batatas]
MEIKKRQIREGLREAKIALFVQGKFSWKMLPAAGLIQILSEDDILSEDIASIVTIPSPIIPASQATSFDPIVPELNGNLNQELLTAVENERNARSRCAAGLIQILSEDDILSEDIASIVTIPSPIIPASQATSFDSRSLYRVVLISKRQHSIAATDSDKGDATDLPLSCVLQQQHIHSGWVLLPLLVAAMGLAGNTAELCTAWLAMQLREGKEEPVGVESSTRSRSSKSSSEYTDAIKVKFGGLEMPISPGVLDDLLERSKNGEGDMETLLSKHVMGEISKAIKRKTEAMMDSCKLEEEFAKEVENKIEELSKPMVKMMGEEGQCGQTRGVMKPMEEREFSTLENLKMTNKAKVNAGTNVEVKDGEKMTGMKNGDNLNDSDTREGDQKLMDARLDEIEKKNKDNPNAKPKSTSGVCENAPKERPPAAKYGRQNEKYVGGRGMTYRGRGGREGFRGGRGGTARRGLNPEARAYEPEGYETEKEEKKHENMSEGGQEYGRQNEKYVGGRGMTYRGRGGREGFRGGRGGTARRGLNPEARAYEPEGYETEKEEKKHENMSEGGQEYGRQNEKYVGGRGMTYRGRGGREGFRGGRGGTARRGLNPEARAYEPEGYETEKEEKKHENMSEGGQGDCEQKHKIQKELFKEGEKKKEMNKEESREGGWEHVKGKEDGRMRGEKGGTKAVKKGNYYGVLPVDVDGDAEHEWDPGDKEEEETSRSVDSDVDFTASVEESESEEEYERLNEIQKEAEERLMGVNATPTKLTKAQKKKLKKKKGPDCEPSFGLFEGDDFEEDTYIEHDGRFERASGHKGGWVGGRRERARDHYEFRYIF